MPPLAATLWALLLFVLVGLAAIYNRLVAARNAVREAWAGVEVQLKRRHDLVPMLAEATKAYASYERDLLEKLAATRARFDPEAEQAISEGLARMLMVAEAYPELKASANFMRLQEALAEVEEKLQLARRYYNGAVRVYNTLLESFPANLVAGPFGFKPARYFEVETASERLAPKVKL